MPLKRGSTNVVRLYKGEMSLKYAYYGTSLPSGEYATPYLSNPEGQSCSIEGEWLSHNPGSGNRYYRCEKILVSQTEVTFLRDNLNRAIHRRVIIHFNANGGSGASSQTRTWGVEQTTQPPNPTRSGYDFQGWATTSGAASPNVTFPRDTPENNIVYYAVWADNAALTWQYDSDSTSSFCFGAPEPVIGTSCSTVNQTQIVPGAINGYGSQCIVVKCR